MQISRVKTWYIKLFYKPGKEGKHRYEIDTQRDEVSQLRQQLMNGDNCASDNDYSEYNSKTTICDEATIPKDPRTLSEHIKCDHKNHETNENCINRLQTYLQGFIDVHQELPIGNDETPNQQNVRLKNLVTAARQRSNFYDNLYTRCNANVLMTAREDKLAGDYMKCRSDLLVCEHKIADHSSDNGTNDVVDCTPTECRTGFHYDFDHCQQNICRCQNGKAVTDKDCQNHDQEKCDPLKCDQGFHYEANHCVKNVCKCQNGRGAAGSDCRVHDQEKCDPLKCNQGFHYEANHCVKGVPRGRDFFDFFTGAGLNMSLMGQKSPSKKFF